MSQTFYVYVAPCDRRPLLAANIIQAAELAYELLDRPTNKLVDIETADETVTFIMNDDGPEEIDRNPLENLVEVRLVVRVPKNVDTAEYLNDADFTCIADDKDLYERVDGYRVLGDLER